MRPGWGILFVLIGFIGSMVTIVLGVGRFTATASSEGTLGIVVLSFFVLILLLYAVIQEFRYSRKARYAESLAHFNNAYNQCIENTNGEVANESILPRLRLVCDQITSAFNMVTATKCSCCIKVLNQDPDEIKVDNPSLEVKTLVRDTNSRKLRGSEKGTVSHWLNANTDFYEIFKNIRMASGRVFFENDLPSRQNYENTSFEIYGKPSPAKRAFLHNVTASFRWPLPYKSTIVAPIYSDEAPEPLVGFFCIDSSSKDVFFKRYDQEIVCSLACALYPLILKWHENNDKKIANATIK